MSELHGGEVGKTIREGISHFFHKGKEKIQTIAPSVVDAAALVTEEALGNRGVEVQLTGESTLRTMWKDPEVRQAAAGVCRTLINVGISFTDIVPVVGDTPSWIADGWKVVTRAFGISRFDLTPDVSIKLALGTELAEIPTLGLAPTHVIETSMQLKHDWPKIKKGFARAREIARQAKELSAQDQEAINQFLPPKV
jgi:hypothetical protein